MNVLGYMAMQKNRLREKHAGETFLCRGGEVAPVSERTTYEILREIDGLKGLNVKERFADCVTC